MSEIALPAASVTGLTTHLAVIEDRLKALENRKAFVMFYALVAAALAVTGWLVRWWVKAMNRQK